MQNLHINFNDWVFLKIPVDVLKYHLCCYSATRIFLAIAYLLLHLLIWQDISIAIISMVIHYTCNILTKVNLLAVWYIVIIKYY